ncbi:MAG: 4-hydroxy-tetrahydrodipicolinate reductase [Pseudomonadota bacterium]
MTRARVVLFGATGRMGRALQLVLAESAQAAFFGAVGRVVAGGHVATDATGAATDPKNLLEQADVCIDFTLPETLGTHLDLCTQHRVAYVSGVTGLGDAAQDALDHAADTIPLLWAPNMSTSVNVCFGAAADIARRLSGEVSVSIHDIHHAGKQDAPSGTALEFGRLIQATGATLQPIRYTSVRDGRHPGEHHILFESGTDQIELRHRAGDRREFAVGAVRAASWLIDQSPGRYNMQNVLNITNSP